MTKHPHIVATDRDRLVMKLLASFSVATSKTLRRIASPTSKYKTFLSRLSTLKSYGYVKELYGNERMRNRHGIYALGNTSIVSVLFPEIGEPKPIPSKSSRTTFKHQILLGDFVSHFFDEVVRKNDPFIVPAINEIRGSDYLLSEISKWRKTSNSPHSGNLPVPDFTYAKGPWIFAFELQNQSSNRQLSNKVANYQYLRIRRNADTRFSLYKGKELVLAVGTRDARKTGASRVLSEFKGKKYLKAIEDFGFFISNST